MCTGSAWQTLASSPITARYSVLILTSFTLILALAEVSIKAQLNCRAKFTPWSLPTTRSSSKSHLFPTNTIGTSSVSCTQDTSLQIKYFAVGQITIEFQVHCSQLLLCYHPCQMTGWKGTTFQRHACPQSIRVDPDNEEAAHHWCSL